MGSTPIKKSSKVLKGGCQEAKKHGSKKQNITAITTITTENESSKSQQFLT